MAAVFSKAVKLLVGSDISSDPTKKPKKRPFKELTERELIQLESEIGAKLFGPVKPGERREFFNEDAKNWIWYEEWIGVDKKRQNMTTRYEIHDNGILKVQDGKPYVYIKGQELKNLSMSIQMYYENVMREIYKRDHRTGEPLN
ncbi:hypothetical protein CVV43_03130 [Candidatus Saccharibacteria bacterium HGW-Saccharibacteria-1]|jgi:hypothetical protein|nr:MAG: hypothetical protein CVV43_03130 [Candidatus Saccharibacteria bacterium HGW-Saccharibacteria-1]